ncbi:hypothetical protein FRC08_009504 [Ceratobasidium sp. 394]|nr:hypothetical protein FRC08_009504 [Ceratobasidium sp. 394]KAG9077423.1 hypothetical protein FS749_010707 [Ceratobasidium sp. UAMH 11750]
MHRIAVPAKGDDFVDPTEEDLTAALLERGDCAVLKELNELRRKGWRSGAIHEHFEHQRHQSDYDKQDGTDKYWVDRMYESMRQMDHTGKFVRASRFLDIGCCPGGYSSYVLRTCPEATGMGITLPVEDGGHGVAIPQDLSLRIDIIMQDLTTYDLAPDMLKPTTNPTQLSTLPFGPHTFDFVMCDAHHLRLCPDNDRRPWNWTRLVVSQLLLGLRAVSAGGTMFVKLSNVERPLTARILIALCRVANHVRAIKPRKLHANRGTFYVLAQGIQTSSVEYKELASGLEQLWHIMTFEGNEGYGKDITWAEQDHVMRWAEVTSPDGMTCIVRLGTRVWQIQRDALKGFLKWKGVDIEGSNDVMVDGR